MCPAGVAAASATVRRVSEREAGGLPSPPEARRPVLLVLTPGFPPSVGGLQQHVFRYVELMSGFRSTVVTLDEPGAGAFDRASGIATVRVPSGRGRAIDIALLNAASLRVGLRLRPDLILSGHLVTSPAARALSLLLSAPVAQMFYAKEIGARPHLASFAARHADVCLLISRYAEGVLADAGGRPRRSVLISPGVDLPAISDPLPVEHPTIVTVSRLEDRYKGHDVMMRALPVVRERVPDVRWVIVGDGPLRGELESRAAALGVADAVSFLGSVPDEERNEWLRRASVFAMPGRLPTERLAGEGYGIVYLEAGTYGKPVVAGNVGGSTDSVQDGHTGLLVDPTDADAVAGALVRVLEDPDLARRLGAAGVVHARERAWPIVAARAEEILLSLLTPAP